MGDMSDDQPSRAVETHRLYAEFEITPADSVSCPIDDLDGSVESINQQLVGDDCHTDTTVQNDDETDIVHSKKALDASCHCPVFVEFDCIPHITEYGADSLIVETYLPNRERLTALIDGLKHATAGVSLRRLTRIDGDGTERSNKVVLELYDLTDKQREAAANAVAAGYYETPREATVGELAAAAGISKSAMSQRLSAVESKLAVSAFR
ncbi:helix-turn-helix domain-containing protein [Natrialbaceae archaeon A-chndr2]|uniref:helix-turn-helix domain-containing protein n=1 Tax=Natronosalvus amylolyticus TaxID=2961994 RepID=UPI0020C9DCF6|nr:helix-turn-helix domain-containing protein [Natronosalvus amylolyticus]